LIILLVKVESLYRVEAMSTGSNHNLSSHSVYHFILLMAHYKFEKILDFTYLNSVWQVSSGFEAHRYRFASTLHARTSFWKIKQNNWTYLTEKSFSKSNEFR
jgi:hypothetical protein